jgi:hypothetical protein
MSPLSAGAIIVGLLSGVAALGIGAASTQDSPRRLPDDPVMRLTRRLESGQATLAWRRDGPGYLPGVLSALEISADSQMLVFAKNSLRPELISPRTPRAIYFNDQVYVGFIPGSPTIEVIALDALEGLHFYTLRNMPSTDPPRFERQSSECGLCHGRGAQATLMTSSVIPSKEGRPFLKVNDTGAGAPDHRTPLERRWGGWYVTGTHGSQRHMGNAVARLPFYPFDLEQEETQNRTTLAGKVDTSPYPQATSDVVALLTFEHQVRMTNLMLRAGRGSGEAHAAEHSGHETAANPDSGIEELVEYMLFAAETPLRAAVRGLSTFAATYPQRGPRDKHGRSLRDFDLDTRLFKYPLSYMIYSPEFDAIAAPRRMQIYQRLYDVLTGKDQSPAFARLSAADRRAVLEIVRDTKPDLPPIWKGAVITK